MTSWDKKSVKEMRSIQDKTLRTFIREQIYPFSPFYRRMFKKHKIDPDSIRCVHDLQKLPFTDKQDIAPSAENKARYKDIVLQPNEKSIKKYFPKGRLIGTSLLHIVTIA